MIPIFLMLGGLLVTNIPEPFITVRDYSQEVFASYGQRAMLTDDLDLAGSVWRDHGVKLYLVAHNIDGLRILIEEVRDRHFTSFDGYCLIVDSFNIADPGPVSALAMEARELAGAFELMFGVSEFILEPFAWDIPGAAKYVDHWLLMGEKAQADPITIRPWVQERKSQILKYASPKISVQFVTWGEFIGQQTPVDVFRAMKKVAGIGIWGCHIDDTMELLHPLTLEGVFQLYYGY
jgi:hypothetical protein